MGRGQSRRAWLIAAIVVIVLIATDHNVGARAGVFAIDQYRAYVSPHLRGKVTCRFTPTCSAYGRESVRKHGLIVGSAKTLWRIARCGPWTKLGTYDPP